MYIFFSSISLLLTLDGASHYFSPKGNQTAEVLIAVINMSSRRKKLEKSGKWMLSVSISYKPLPLYQGNHAYPLPSSVINPKKQ